MPFISRKASSLSLQPFHSIDVIHTYFIHTFRGICTLTSIWKYSRIKMPFEAGALRWGNIRQDIAQRSARSFFNFVDNKKTVLQKGIRLFLFCAHPKRYAPNCTSYSDLASSRPSPSPYFISEWHFEVCSASQHPGNVRGISPRIPVQHPLSFMNKKICDTHRRLGVKKQGDQTASLSMITKCLASPLALQWDFTVARPLEILTQFLRFLLFISNVLRTFTLYQSKIWMSSFFRAANSVGFLANII